MSLADFYRAFEDQHRGSRELIQLRQQVFLPFVRALAALHPGAPVSDLGCGRGEWLELLKTHGIEAQGVDQDEGMLAACRERGLQVRRGDAIEFLQQLPDGSQGVVTGFHIAEHLPFETLQVLVRESLRVLRPGGLLILETPNPENLAVGTAGFYMDPTHQRPLPAPLLAFLAQYHGFERVKTLRLQESDQLHGNKPVTLLDVLTGVSPDYAVIAQKSADAAQADVPALAQLGQAFAPEHGVSLNALAERHEHQWASRLHYTEGVAQAARHAAVAAQAAVSQAVHKVATLDHQVKTEMLAIQTELLHSRRELLAMRESSSWRVTAPLRWLGGQRRALREQGLAGRARRVAGRGARVSIGLALRVADRLPWLRRATGRALRALGLKPLLDRLRPAPADPNAATAPPAPMTPQAQRIHGALTQAIAARAAMTEVKE